MGTANLVTGRLAGRTGGVPSQPRIPREAMEWNQETVAELSGVTVRTIQRVDGREAQAGIAEWIGFYNNQRPHQALDNRTPISVWRDNVTATLARGLRCSAAPKLL